MSTFLVNLQCHIPGHKVPGLKVKMLKEKRMDEPGLNTTFLRKSKLQLVNREYVPDIKYKDKYTASNHNSVLTGNFI